jgi:hypothetical protein
MHRPAGRLSRKAFACFLTILLASTPAFVGCRRTASVSNATTVAAGGDEDKVGVASSMEAFHKGTDVKSCRSALK